MTIETTESDMADSRLNVASTAKVTGLRILATGMFVPDNVVKNEDLAELGCDSEWIVQRTGILSRQHITATEATSDMAYEACRRCLETAGVDPTEVDFIIVCTMTPDYPCPSTSCQIQNRLGCRHIAAVDINAACSGFMYGLVMGAQFIRTGAYQRVLVVGAESMSTTVDPRDVKTFPLFGDAAAAVLLGPSNEDPGLTQSDSPVAQGFGALDPEETGILAFKLAADGSLGDKLLIPAGGSRKPVDQEVIDNRLQFLKMDGRVVFKWAVRLIPEIVNEMLDASGLVQDDIDMFIFHQANKRILDAAMESLNISADKVLVNLDRYGNTSAASIPISLHEAIGQGRVKAGSKVLMAGFGAGLTWGGCVFQF